MSASASSTSTPTRSWPRPERVPGAAKCENARCRSALEPSSFCPPILAHRRTARHHPRHLRNGQVLSYRVPPQSEAPSDLVLWPPTYQCVKISQISITSNVLLAIGPPVTKTSGIILTPMTRSTRHACPDHGK